MANRYRPHVPGLRESNLEGLEINTVFGHATERYSNLRFTFGLLYPLCKMGVIPKGAETSIKGAKWQKATGSQTDDTQAAHTFPRRLMINETSLADWIKRANIDLLSDAFPYIEGTTTTLPSFANRADTRWENNGLSDNYARAAAEILHVDAKNPRAAADHYEGVWAQFHHNAASSLLKARIGAEGDVAGVLGQYHVIHGSASSKDAEKPQVLNIWNMVTS